MQPITMIQRIAALIGILLLIFVLASLAVELYRHRGEAPAFGNEAEVTRSMPREVP